MLSGMGQKEGEVFGTDLTPPGVFCATGVEGVSGSGVPLGREGQDAAESPRARGAQLPVGDHDVTSLPTSCCIRCGQNSVRGIIKM